mgnify:CR=1 FL=1
MTTYCTATFSILYVISQLTKTRTVVQITKSYPRPALLIISLDSGQDYSPLCTSTGCILQLCKVLSALVRLLRLREIWTARQKNRQTVWFLNTPQHFVYGGIFTKCYRCSSLDCLANTYLTTLRSLAAYSCSVTFTAPTNYLISTGSKTQ